MAAPSERAGWKQEPTGEMVLGWLQNYLSHLSKQTKNDKRPVFDPSHYGPNRPHERREQGGYVVGGFLALHGRLATTGDLTIKPGERFDEAIERGKAIFGRLDEFRFGPEGLLDNEQLQPVHNLAEDRDTPELALARLAVTNVLEDTTWQRARTTIIEARTALELDALARSTETAA